MVRWSPPASKSHARFSPEFLNFISLFSPPQSFFLLVYFVSSLNHPFAYVGSYDDLFFFLPYFRCMHTRTHTHKCVRVHATKLTVFPLSFFSIPCLSPSAPQKTGVTMMMILLIFQLHSRYIDTYTAALSPGGHFSNIFVLRVIPLNLS